MAHVPTGTTHWASSNERQRRIVKSQKNMYSKPYMYISIWKFLYIKLILKIFIFRVFWVVIQVYNEISKGSSVVNMWSRYGKRWRIGWKWF